MRKTLKRMLAFVLAWIMISNSCLNGSAMEFSLVEENAEAQTTELEQKQEEIIEINSLEGLLDISNNLEGHFKLMRDIDLNGYSWNPIGTEELPFSGELDGNGHIIKNFIIKSNSSGKINNFGFFGTLEKAKISNIALQGKIAIASANKENTFGLLSGAMRETSVENCAFSAEINHLVKNEESICGIISGRVDKDSSFTKVCYENTSDNYFGEFENGIQNDEIISFSLEEMIQNTGFSFDVEDLANEELDFSKEKQKNNQEEQNFQEMEEQNQETEETIQKTQEQNQETEETIQKTQEQNQETEKTMQETEDNSDNSEEKEVLSHKRSATTYSWGDSNGTCGNNLTWELLDGVLTISGTGDMDDYFLWGPWLSLWVRKIIIEDGVTSIGNNAFTGLDNATEAVIPDSVIRIGDNAFRSSGISKISMGDSVRIIGGDAFAGCDFEEIQLPDTLESIGDRGFYGCNFLKEIQLPSALTSMGNHVFQNCSALNKITLSPNVKYIPGWAFSGCISLDSIKIPDGVTWIGSGAFQNCSSMKKIIIPESVVKVMYKQNIADNEDPVFLGCNNLLTAGPLNGGYNIEFGWKTEIPENTFMDSDINKIVFPEKLEKIGYRAFYQCKNLETIDFPASLSVLQTDAFAACTSLYKVTFPQQCLIQELDRTFMNCTSLKKIEVPEGIKKMYQTFRGCTDLSSIHLPKSIEEADWIFYECENIKTAGPKGKTYDCQYEWEEMIPEETFFECAGLEEITFPDSLNTIGCRAFYHTKIKKVLIPSNVSKMYGAFAGCTLLTDVNFEEGICVENLSSSFEGCTSLQNIDIPDSVKYLLGTFIGCTALKKMVIPEGVNNLEKAFINCKSLNLVSVPKSAIYFDNTFKGCDGLKTAGSKGSGYNYQFEWEENIPDEAFKGAESLDFIDLPDTITEIGEEAFSGCKSLESIYIPQDVSVIKRYAFKDCTNLTEIKLPEKITKLGHSLFKGCLNLQTIYLECKEVSFFDGCFDEAEATAYYKKEDTSWTKKAQEKCGGDIEWIPFEASKVKKLETKKKTTLNNSGRSYGKFYLCDTDQNILPMEKFTYTYSYNGMTYNMYNSYFMTDKDGAYKFETPHLEYKEGEDNTYDVIFHVKSLEKGHNLLNKDFTIQVTVTPLVYTEEWSFSLSDEATISKLFSFDRGGKATISLEHKEDGKQDLKLSVELTQSEKGKMKGNLKDTLSTVGKEVKSGALDIGNTDASATLKKSETYSTTIENFDFEDKENQEMLASYLLLVFGASASKNVMLLELFNRAGYMANIPQIFTMTETGFSVKMQANATALTLDLEPDSEESLLDTSLLKPVKIGALNNTSSYGYNVSMDDGLYTFNSSLQAENEFTTVSGGILGMLGYTGLYGSSKMNKISFSANKEKLELKTGKYDSGNQDAISNKIVKYRKYVAEGEMADKICEMDLNWDRLRKGVSGPISNQNNNTMAKSFTKQEGVLYYDTEEDMDEIEWAPSIDISWPDSENGKKSTLTSIGFNVKIERSYSTETANGIYSDGYADITSDSCTSMTNVLANQTTCDKIFKTALLGVGVALSDCAGYAMEGIEKGVEYGNAVVEGIVQSAFQWSVSITGLKNSRSVKSNSYSVKTLVAQDESNSNNETVLAATVGQPYIVEVVDEDGNELTDLSKQPLLLKLSYTEEDLNASKVSPNDVDKLAIYRYDGENNVYTYVGGMLNEAENTISSNITETGEYILVADGAEPEISGLTVSDTSSKPRITANITDISDIKTISLEIDGEEIINENNYNDYYNKKTGVFSCQIVDPLSVGEHSLIITVVDERDNEQITDPYSFLVEEAPVFHDISVTEVAIPGDVITFKVNTQENNAADISAQVKIVKKSGEKITRIYDLEKENQDWIKQVEVEKGTTSYSVNFVAKTIGGSVASSKDYICNIPKDNIYSYPATGGNIQINLKQGKIISCDRGVTEADIPLEILGHQITEIKNKAFYNCDRLIRLSLPNTMIRIGERAFEGCSSLTSLVLPDGIKTIEEYAFLNCSSLMKINIPSMITRVEDGVFNNCLSLEDVEIPDSVTSLGYCSFCGCESLKKITIPFDVTDIKYDSFQNCSSDLVIYTPKGSFAHQYAQKYKLKVSFIKDGKIRVQVSDYSDVYDGRQHGIDISVTNPNAEYTIYYSTTAELSEDNYTTGTTLKPMMTEVGTTTIYYYVVSDGYKSAKGHGVVNIRQLDFEKDWLWIDLSADCYCYDGKPKEPEVEIDDLVKGRDYDVSYSDNIEVGTATVTIIGKGNCTGTKTKTFTIFKAEEINENQQYDVEFTEEYEKKFYNFTATQNMDYIVSYEAEIELYDSLFDMDMQRISYDYQWDNINNKYICFYHLEKGKSYYICVGCYGEAGTAQVQMEKFYHCSLDGGYHRTMLKGTKINFKLNGSLSDTSTVLWRTESYDGKTEKYKEDDSVSLEVTEDGVIVTSDVAKQVKIIVEIYEGKQVVCSDNKELSFVDESCEMYFNANYMYVGDTYWLDEYFCQVYNEDYPYGDDMPPSSMISSNPQILEIGSLEYDDGDCYYPIVARKEGKVTVIVTLNTGNKIYKKEFPVTVYARGEENTDTTDNTENNNENTITNGNVDNSISKKDVKISDIRLFGISHNIAYGKKLSLKASIFPINSSVQKIIWSTSNPKVATVTQRGVVTVKKKTGGKSVTITATAADGSGISASWKIKSMKGVVKKVTVSGAKTVKAGKSLKLKAKVTATKGANKKLKWTSSNTKYATVTSSGKVKTFKVGKGKKVKITAMATDGSGKKKSVIIKIK